MLFDVVAPLFVVQFSMFLGLVPLFFDAEFSM